jgi:hypothetical protein
MSNATILLNKTEDNLEARDTILIAENTSTKDNNILFPDINLNYDIGDIDDNLNTERTIKEKQDQYIITSTDTINTAVTSEFTDYFLNYKKTDNSVTWVGNRATGTLTNVEANSRKVIPIEDFNTNVQMGISGRNYKDDKDETNYHTWVSLHACVSDIGLHQASWNTNEAYYASHNLTYHETNSNKILNVRFSHSDSMAGIVFSISYLLADGTSGTGTMTLNTEVSAGSDFKLYYPLKFTSTGTPDVKIFKLNSVEITTCPSGTTVNNGDIEFFFINNTGETQDQDNGITSLEMSLNNTDFDYNCEYLNCQYANQYYNKNINLIQYRDDIDHTDKITFNASGVTDGGGGSGVNIAHMYDHIKESYEDDHADLGAYTGGFGDFELLFNGGETLVLELEGGSGRKASIQIDKETPTNTDTFTISNAGYLYTQYETLRIKDYRLRDLLNFKVVSTGDIDIRTEHVQDFIKTGHSKANTIKYSLAKTESFVIKSLSISGSVKSDIIVRLIQVKNIFSSTPIQYVLKEFYYYKRTNIQEKHDLNIFISNSGDIGNEIFVDIQKIVKDNNDKSREDTLNFTLNGIKYKNS